MSAIVLRDEIVHYEVLGRGRPLIFLHGWVGSWRYWIPTMQAASVSFRAYAIDLWGFGDSAKNPACYGLDQQVDLVDQFLQEMGIGKVALVGHGLGAAVALLFAAQFPRLVDRMLLVGLPHTESMLNPRLQTASPAELAGWLLHSPATEPALAEAPKADPQAIQHSIAGLRGHDLFQDAAALSIPCLMVYGQDDPALDVSRTDGIAALPEHIHQVFFDPAGHFPMLDEPSKFNRLMSDFLALASGASPQQLQLKEEWKRRVR